MKHPRSAAVDPQPASLSHSTGSGNMDSENQVQARPSTPPGDVPWEPVARARWHVRQITDVEPLTKMQIGRFDRAVMRDRGLQMLRVLDALDRQEAVFRERGAYHERLPLHPNSKAITPDSALDRVISLSRDITGQAGAEVAEAIRWLRTLRWMRQAV